MVNKPKRRKYKDNPYVIERINGINFISFKDGNDQLQIVEVNQNIYDVFDESELMDISQMHKDEKHLDFRIIDNTDKMDNFLYQNSYRDVKSVDDCVLENINNDNLKEAIKFLTETQKRRIKLHFFEDKSFSDIARIENCDESSVRESIYAGIKKIKKNLK